MIRKKKLFVRQKKLYIKSRIKEENSLLSRYGLKNKKEIWKTAAKINYLRKMAMALAKLSAEKQQALFNKLKGLGLKTETTADVLALKTEDLLERRLPFIVFKKGLAKTPQHARQMVVHKKILIDDKTVNVPSYTVSINEESAIKIRPTKEKKVQKNKAGATEATAQETTH